MLSYIQHLPLNTQLLTQEDLLRSQAAMHHRISQTSSGHRITTHAITTTLLTSYQCRKKFHIPVQCLVFGIWIISSRAFRLRFDHTRIYGGPEDFFKTYYYEEIPSIFTWTKSSALLVLHRNNPIRGIQDIVPPVLIEHI